MGGLGAKLPLTISPSDGAYGLIKDFKAMVTQNLKMLVLTNPGERIMDLNFGVGLRRYFFENSSPVVFDDIKTRIFEQVAKYMPFLRIDDVVFKQSGEDGVNISNFVSVKIFYTILPLNINDVLALQEKTNE